ncbi:hypothetical protein DITRI_Ditri06bG0084000 [Diplodiscus trichospermus]
MAKTSSAQDVGSEQGTLLGFPLGPIGGVTYPQPRNEGHMIRDGFANYQGDYGRNLGGLPMIPP